MARFPMRTGEHSAESASLKALDRCIPAQWLFRHVTERDYGIDCLIEIVWPNGEVRGDIFAVQLKSRDALGWSAPDDEGNRWANISGIGVATARYWMGLPMPVVLAIHERTSDRLLVADAKRQIRRKYAVLNTQVSMSFRLMEDFALGTQLGDMLLVAVIFREQSFAGYAGALLDLLSHDTEYGDMVAYGLGADFFLEVTPEQVVRLRRLLRSAATVSGVTGAKWDIPSFEKWLEEDRREFNDPWGSLHYQTFDRILRRVGVVFVEILQKGRKLVCETERAYWQERDPLLVEYCERDEAQAFLTKIERAVKANV